MGIPQVIDMPTGQDITSLLMGMSAPKEGRKGKSKTPVVAGHEAAADAANLAKQQFKQAETEKEMADEAIIEVARREYETRACGGAFTKTISFPGASTPGVQVSFMDKWRDLPIDLRPAIVGEVGPEFATLFEEHRRLTLKKTDDETIRFLLDALGGETFQAIFEIAVVLHPRSGFDQRQFELSDNVRQLAGQYKPSIKNL